MTAVLNEDNRNMLFEKGIPDPFSGLNVGFLKKIKEEGNYQKTQEKAPTAR